MRREHHVPKLPRSAHLEVETAMKRLHQVLDEVCGWGLVGAIFVTDKGRLTFGLPVATESDTEMMKQFLSEIRELCDICERELKNKTN